MNVAKQARKDAAEFAAAQMAYGKGAGTRRKMIKATVDHRADTIPGYLSAFYEAALAQDMTKHVAEAKRAGRAKAVGTVVSKNAKGLVTKDYRMVNGGVLIVAGVAYFSHKYGYDKLAWEKVKGYYHKIKDRSQAKVYVMNIMNETKSEAKS